MPQYSISASAPLDGFVVYNGQYNYIRITSIDLGGDPNAVFLASFTPFGTESFGIYRDVYNPMYVYPYSYTWYGEYYCLGFKCYAGSTLRETITLFKSKDSALTRGFNKKIELHYSDIDQIVFGPWVETTNNSSYYIYACRSVYNGSLTLTRVKK